MGRAGKVLLVAKYWRTHLIMRQIGPVPAACDRHGQASGAASAGLRTA